MIKKIAKLTALASLVLCLSGCGKSQSGAFGTGDSAQDRNLQHAWFEVVDRVISIRVDRKISREEDSWAGICQIGSYVTEETALEKAYVRSYEESGMYYLDTASLSPGDYKIVFCSSETSGVVLFQMNMNIDSVGHIFLNGLGYEIGKGLDAEITISAKSPDWNGKKVWFTQVGRRLRVELDKTVTLQEDAWMGIMDYGVYVLERLADRKELMKRTQFMPHTFDFDLTHFEPGTYTIIFCTYDDGGDVVFNFHFTIDSSGKVVMDKTDI